MENKIKTVEEIKDEIARSTERNDGKFYLDWEDVLECCLCFHDQSTAANLKVLNELENEAMQKYADQFIPIASTCEHKNTENVIGTCRWVYCNDCETKIEEDEKIT